MDYGEALKDDGRHTSVMEKREGQRGTPKGDTEVLNDDGNALKSDNEALKSDNKLFKGVKKVMKTC